ncbi:unnamed protein product [Chrysoparadoxa australica]
MEPEQEVPAKVDELFASDSDSDDAPLVRKPRKKSSAAPVDDSDVSLEDSDDEDAPKKPQSKKLKTLERKAPANKAVSDDSDFLDSDDEEPSKKRKKPKKTFKKRKGLRGQGDSSIPRKKPKQKGPGLSEADFIDTNDDDAELLEAYELADLARREEGSESEAEEDNGPQEEASLGAMDATLKAMKRKSKQQLSLGECEHIAQELKRTMGEAAAADIAAVKNGKPALAKLKCMKGVCRALSKNDLQEALLDYDVLGSVKVWLQPYPGGTLPNITLRKAMFAQLQALPIHVDHLKESGIGRVVLALYKHKDETLENKRVLKGLIERWNRPIFRKETNYRSMHQIRADEDIDRGIDRQNRPARVATSGDTASAVDLLSVNRNRPSDDGRSRARVPMSAGFAFKYKPADNINPVEGGRGPPKEESRLRKKMMEKKTNSRGLNSKNLSIEGRGAS